VLDRLRGFYAVIDRRDDALADALLASATVLQVRVKGGRPGELEAVARWARARTAAAGALLVVNDDLAIAEAVGADAVHLGQDDLPLAEARRRTRLLIGVSTHDLDQVARAVAGGADYLGYGPIYPTATKADPDPVQGLTALAAAVRAAGAVPVVAIGGVTPARAAELRAAGAAAACAIAAVNHAAYPAAAARTIAAAFD
jgi:thiamine-phosphate pyrophosphorylase